MENHLQQHTETQCEGPATNGNWDGGLHCLAFDEPACRHVLVLIKAVGTPVDTAAEQLVRDWCAKAGINSEVVVILPQGEDSADLPRSLRNFHRLTDNGLWAEIGLQILRAAGIGERRKLFLSYRRDDTAELADQIHEALSRQGLRVYVDRFSWTAGRLFPQEIAEELADSGVLLLLESDNLHRSRWTQWELAFARLYHMGLIALNVDAAPHQNVIDSRDRLSVTTNTGGQLDPPDLRRATDFIIRRYSLAELRRRVFFEGLLRQAVDAAGGSMRSLPDGVFEITGPHIPGLVLPSGRPGNLEDLSTVSRISPGSAPRILIGQHLHLSPRAKRDVEWIAEQAGIILRVKSEIARSVNAIISGGTP